MYSYGPLPTPSSFIEFCCMELGDKVRLSVSEPSSRGGLDTGIAWQPLNLCIQGVLKILFSMCFNHLCSSHFPLPLCTHTHTHKLTKAQVVRYGMMRQQALCQRTSGTCNYYRSCLESQFSCGKMGFILEYAKQRCEAVRKLEPSSSGCSTCIKNEELFVWSHRVEVCIQDSLTSLINSDFKSTTNMMQDPTRCQSFEQSAIEKINACYGRDADYPKLCSILGAEIDEDEMRDLKTLVSNFNIGNHYHNSTVDSGIPELVRECGHPEVADSLYVGQPTTRIIFCTWGELYPSVVGPEHNYFPHILSENLNDDISHFKYGGPDGTNACTDWIPSNVQNSDEIKFHIVTWFAPSNHPVAQKWNWTELATIITVQATGIFGYFELSLDREDPAGSTIRDSTKCGDGVRHAGEVCDYAMINTPACSFNCEIQNINSSVYECSVERLSQSYCWVQVCGDGRRTSNEECDDGNLQNHDGCNSRCRVEKEHYSCIGQYNATTVCSKKSPIVAAQHQSTRSQIVLVEHTEPPEVESSSLDSPIEISAARQLISRSELLLLTVSLTLWTMLILA